MESTRSGVTRLEEGLTLKVASVTGAVELRSLMGFSRVSPQKFGTTVDACDSEEAITLQILCRQ